MINSLDNIYGFHTDHMYVTQCFLMQFYDHFFDWGLKDEITQLTSIRARNGIHPGSTLRIVASDADLYLAAVDEKIMVKIGTRYDVGNLVPPNFHVVAHGNDYAVWEKNAGDTE